MLSFLECLVALSLLTIPVRSHSLIPTIELKKSMIENLAIQNSLDISALKNEVEAEKMAEEASYSRLFPSIDFDVSYKYLTSVPALSTGQNDIKLGDNHNYSAGLKLNWLIFDGGFNYHYWKKSKLTLKVKEEELEVVKKKTLLLARMAYFKVGLLCEELRLELDTLKLLRSEHNDIRKKMTAGTSNRIDYLSSSREVLNLTSQILKTQSSLGEALQELFNIINYKKDVNTKAPLFEKTQMDSIPVSVFINVEKFENLLPKTKPVFNFEPDKNNMIKKLSKEIESMEENVLAIKSGLFPKLLANAKSSFDYPNGTKKETIQQNMVSATLTIPIFEWSKTRNEASRQEFILEALKNRKESLLKTIIKEKSNAENILDSLYIQEGIIKESIDKAVKLANIVYSNFRAGRINYLEVQAANHKVLESKIQLARLHFDILAQISKLDDLCTN